MLIVYLRFFSRIFFISHTIGIKCKFNCLFVRSFLFFFFFFIPRTSNKIYKLAINLKTKSIIIKSPRKYRNENQFANRKKKSIQNRCIHLHAHCKPSNKLFYTEFLENMIEVLRTQLSLFAINQNTHAYAECLCKMTIRYSIGHMQSLYLLILFCH